MNTKQVSHLILSVSVVLSFLLSSCGTLLLPNEKIKQYILPKTEEHEVIYHTQHYLNTADGKLFSTTHSLIQIGENIQTAPDYFAVIDGSDQKLVDFEARLLKKDGEEKSFSASDLNTISTSSSYRISEVDIKYLPVSEIIETGDVLEMVSVHEFLLPATGIRFSPSYPGNHAENIECIIEIQKNDSLRYNIINDEISPQISQKENSKIYKFSWKDYSRKHKNPVFKYKNIEPAVYAQVPGYFNENTESVRSIKNWSDFGDWYLDLIKPKLNSNNKIDSIARNICAGKTSDLEKMDAIFQYCQKNIRYEQVYLRFGELIPNECDIILKRKYGDCKDYSTLIYSMAKSAGLNPNFALCYRGRGIRFYEEIPVSQFNHVIIHFEDNGKHYWYDGTNRTGIPGITTMDLINQPALVIEKNNSHFITISEVESNLLNITADLYKSGSGLYGDLKISLSQQYAMLFFYLDFYYNDIKMQEYLIDWVKSNLNHNFMIKNIGWDKNSDEFNMTINCEIPNSVVDLNSKSYTSFNNVLPELFDPDNLPKDSNDLYYFNGYNRVKINLNFDNLVSVQNEKSNLEIDYTLPAGPFSDEEKTQFRNEYKKITKKFKTRHAFRKADSI